MSVEIVESATHIASDVDDSRSFVNSVVSCDSGIDNVDVESTVCPDSTNFNLSPLKSGESVSDFVEGNGVLSTENEVSSELSSPTSLSSDDKDNQNVFDQIETENCVGLNDEQANVDKNKFNPNLYIDSNLATSTISLDCPNGIEKISLSNHSRSAENISSTDETNAITKEIETEKILNEFSHQKSKVTATQRVPENTLTLDAKYARLPKEILSQDIGSIVKNVHGIFSSVSGSLKNAYTNSHRANPKPQIKLVKPISNGNIINDIFEDVPEVMPSNIDKVNTSVNDNTLDGKPVHNGDDAKSEMLKLQIESLERVLFEQRKENSSLRVRVKQQVDELQAKDQTFRELEVKVDMMCKRLEQAQREKDAAVMRYASTECAVIEAKKAAETAAKAEKAAIAEMELLNAKLKTAREEKQRICQLYDDKCHELQNSEREVTQVKEELKEVEGRLKWTQSKLRVEMDAYKDSTERVEKLNQQLIELEASKETAVANASDVAKVKQLESDLKESQAALILCRHESQELEKRATSLAQQLDTCKKERDDVRAALVTAEAQVSSLKESNIRLELEAAELASLRARAALADTLAGQLERETARASSAEESLSVERARADTCARREAAALQHAATLTADHVAQRARLADQHAAVQALTADNNSLRERILSLTEELKTVVEERARENRALARKIAELSEELNDVTKKLEWEKGENNILKKKHSSAIKEMNRELQRALKRIEQLEAKIPADTTSTRTESVSSLSSSESPEERANTQTDTLPDVQAREPDRQALVERIVSLQRAAAARAERCEFLQEHCAQLTRELRGKGRILRALLPTLPSAALTSDTADNHKKEIARIGGGVMAAVWGGDPGGMTLELSLEMNRRLQAVLEDTLLKNITLKENMDTLGEEISRLRGQTKCSDAK
ncbi:coiled-coil domain-containing protein 186 isoform X2 [Danaus plexippus]|uniref:coiled-coil domain-containing protein 186 isoform X2 n=1 Tax=Danaus plexippus TaxID=13037 RepID=UPI002AB0D984|nr:coiled-coil domain-containing protein 186 isoform X2 [Danaus plexippus]